MEFAVLGPGGVGGLLAALLIRSGNSVVVLARDETAETLESGGLRVESARFGDFEVPVRAAARLKARVDACFVTVKATQLTSALERVPADVLGGGLVVPFLNGLEHVELLRGIYGAGRVAPATIRVESTRTSSGLVWHTSPFAAVEIAASQDNRERVERIAAAIAATGIDVRLRDDELAMLWDKFALLAPLALLTTHEGASVGAVRYSRRDDLVALIAELASVAAADGVEVDPSRILELFDTVPDGMRSSMQRDQEAGRPMELDALGGAVLRRAAAHGIAVPVTQRLVEELAAREGYARELDPR
jgi:2-dehydropantoate 2-reductase